MIQLLGNKIYIPQGEEAGVSISFRDNKYNAPWLVLDTGDESKHRLVFRVRKGMVVNTSLVIFEKIFNTPNDDGIFPSIFKTREIGTVKIQESNAVIDTDYLVTSDGELVEGVEAYKLYKITNDVWSVFKYCVLNDQSLYEEKIYDYTNSTLDIPFNKTDTENMMPGTYYYTIVHEIVDNNNNVIAQETLISPSEFIIKGAI